MREDALRMLRALPDGAGPVAFLAAIRENAMVRVLQGDER
jgi:hypothetical protein